MTTGRVLPALAGMAVLAVLPGAASQQPTVTHDVSNGALAVSIRATGGAIASVVLADDPARLNPMHALGHFVCVDGFGPPSDDERAAGLPMHGEANQVPWDLVARARDGATTTLAFRAELPLVHEVLRRTYRMVDGENVLYVDSALDSELAFDRPVNWGEHATIGPPFLALATTSVEMSATQAMTRSHASQSAAPPHRLASFVPFTWPMAPAIDGGLIDVRPAPLVAPVGDHTTSLMDPARRLVFVTAVNAERRLVLGYVFRGAEYPWTQLWEYYPVNGRLARGLEFAMQPFDMPRREIAEMATLLGVPTYRWLPARSTVRTSFLLFYARLPDGMQRVDDVTLEDGRLRIVDRGAARTLTLAASRGL